VVCGMDILIDMEEEEEETLSEGQGSYSSSTVK